MLTESDVAVLMKAVADVVKDFVSKNDTPLKARLDELDTRIAALPAPKDGAPGKDGEPGAAGKDADVVEIEKFITIEMAGIYNKMEKCIHELPTAKDGAPGAPGAPGKNADPEIIAELIKECVGAMLPGLVEEAVATIPIPKNGKDGEDGKDAEPPSFLVNDAGELVAVYLDGETKHVGAVRGKDGARGASVMDGSVDAEGQLVLRMSDGRIINTGIVRGKDGKDGEGKQGVPGRDATEIRIMPSLDETRSYPEGTCALYRGGMVRAERATDPLVDGDPARAGWRVALEGIAEENEQEIDDGRVIERTTIYTSGKVFTRRVTTSALIYRGIWRDGDFKRGDSVTWDGSLWHCERPTREKPGATMDWKLVAKRGRDGKDGASIKGDPGEPGRPGRDLTQMAHDGSKH